jgi:hypothetical protein
MNSMFCYFCVGYILSYFKLKLDMHIPTYILHTHDLGRIFKFNFSICFEFFAQIRCAGTGSQKFASDVRPSILTYFDGTAARYVTRLVTETYLPRSTAYTLALLVLDFFP